MTLTPWRQRQGKWNLPKVDTRLIQVAFEWGGPLLGGAICPDVVCRVEWTWQSLPSMPSVFLQ